MSSNRTEKTAQTDSGTCPSAGARETALREILQTINRSRADERPVFDAIVRNAARLCDAGLVGLSLVNDARTHLHYTSICGEDRGVFQTGFEFDLNGPLQISRAVREARIIHTPDLSDDPLYAEGNPVRKKIVDEAGVRTFLTVPLIRDGVALGCLNLNRFEVRPFSDADIVLIETFAEQAVIAIENVRQFREVQEQLERERASAEILHAISQNRADERPVFDVILENASRLCHAPFAGLYMLDETRSEISLVASLGARTEYLTGADRRWSIDDPASVGVAIREGRTEQADDIRDTDAYRQGNKQRVEAADIEGIRTFLAVPLMHNGVAIGAIGLYRRDVARFQAPQVALVENFATQAVIAIENVRQFNALQDRTAEVERLNTGLEQRVATQVDELERMGRLKRFLSPQVADAVVSSGGTALLGSHRALIATLFCDIRGFTAFCETAEPEEAIEVLQTFHESMGVLLADYGAGVDHRAGDGIMAIFNDPLPCDDPTGDALRMAVAMRDRMAGLCRDWRRVGHRLGFGIGISLGYATVGMVGTESRYDYTASGTAVNLAARLCDHAGDGDILLSPRAFAAVQDMVKAESVGEITLKGIQAPIEVFRVIDLLRD